MFTLSTLYSAVIFGGVAWFMVVLVKKIEALEVAVARLSGSRSSGAIDVQTFLRKLRDYHLGRCPRSGEPLDATDAAQELALIMATERPALESVLTFSMWMSKDYLLNVVGLTDGELDDLKDTLPDRMAPAVFAPASSMTIEAWATHTVIFDNGRYAKTIYKGTPWTDPCDPHVIWQHSFAPTDSDGGWSLEIVLWDKAIRCWARGGRFKGRYWSGEAEDEFQFITVPLDRTALTPFLRPDTEPPDPECGYKTEPWDAEYEYSDDGKGTGWYIRIRNNVAYAQR